MEVNFEFKYIVLVLFFLHIFSNGRCMITYSDKEKEIVNISSYKVSNAQGEIALQWPKGIVTYYLDNLVYDYYTAQRVRMAMNVLESASCVRFKPILIKPTVNITWVHFTNPRAERNCVHKPDFKNDGEIILVLGFDCLEERQILHTLLHAIGFKDEVSHPHRDQYIRVMWNNIQPEYRNLYHIQSSNEGTSKYLVEYDPLSIMHFHDRAFSINGHATVVPLVPGLLISPSHKLSQLDKMRLRLVFDHECNKRKVGDMMDTCKMLLANKAETNDVKNVTDPKSEENLNDTVKENKPVEVTDLKSEEKINETVEEEKPTKIDVIDDVEQVDEVEEQMQANAAGDHYDLNEHQPDDELAYQNGKKQALIETNDEGAISQSSSED